MSHFRQTENSLNDAQWMVGYDAPNGLVMWKRDISRQEVCRTVSCLPFLQELVDQEPYPPTNPIIEQCPKRGLHMAPH